MKDKDGGNEDDTNDGTWSTLKMTSITKTVRLAIMTKMIQIMPRIWTKTSLNNRMPVMSTTLT